MKVLFFALFLLLFSSPALSQEGLRISIDFPDNDSYFGRPQGPATIAGRVLYPGKELPTYDVILVLDVSGSTAYPTGVDVDGDGILGKIYDIDPSRKRFYPVNIDPDDSVLCAEVVGAKNLLRFLNPATTRVGLVVFSGDISEDGKTTDPSIPDARLEIPLTSDYAAVDRILTDLYDRNPEGGTNMIEGIREAQKALLSAEDARPNAQKLMVFLTDGQPTFPSEDFITSDPTDKELTVKAAKEAAEAGIRIYTYAIGKEALEDPTAVQQMAQQSKGVYTPVEDPARITQLLPEIRFIEMSSLTVENVTLNQTAEQILLGPDGTFLATVPVALGVNLIQAVAMADQGEKGEASVTLHYVDDGAEARELGLNLKQGKMADLLQRSLELQRGAILDAEIGKALEKTQGVRKEGLELELEMEE